MVYKHRLKIQVFNCKQTLLNTNWNLNLIPCSFPSLWLKLYNNNHLTGRNTDTVK